MQTGDKYVWKYEPKSAYVLEDKIEGGKDGRAAWNCKVYNIGADNKFYPRRGRMGTSAGGGIYDENGIVFESTLTDLCELDNSVEIELEYPGVEPQIFTFNNQIPDDLNNLKNVWFQSVFNSDWAKKLTQQINMHSNTTNYMPSETSKLKDELRAAINEYVKSCGGDPKVDLDNEAQNISHNKITEIINQLIRSGNTYV